MDGLAPSVMMLRSLPQIPPSLVRMRTHLPPGSEGASMSPYVVQACAPM